MLFILARRAGFTNRRQSLHPVLRVGQKICWLLDERQFIAKLRKMKEEQQRPASTAATLFRRVLHPGKPAMKACTIVARNYLAQAEVLARSFKQYHPECPFAILVVDDLHVREVREDGV